MKNLRHLSRLIIMITSWLSATGPLWAQPIADRPLLPAWHETVWLSSPRHLYLTGETVQTEIRILEQSTYLRSSVSQSVRLELLDSAGIVISKKLIKVTNGQVSDALNIPAQLKSGWYYLRAYTNWMRNFSPLDFSLLPIRVVKPEESQNLSLLPQNSPLVVKLFPSGGYWMAHGETEAGLLVTTAEAVPVAVRGHFVASGQDTLCSFSTDASGYTLITLPDSGLKGLELILEGYANSRISWEKPTVTSEWPMVHFVRDQGGIRLSLQMTDHAISLPDGIRLMLHEGDRLLWSDTVPPHRSEHHFVIPAVNIPKGISQLTLVNEGSEAFWTRLTAEPLGLEACLLKSDRARYDYRQPGQLTFNPPGGYPGSEFVAQIAVEEPDHPLNHYMPGYPGWPAKEWIPAQPDAFKGWLLAHRYHNVPTWGASAVVTEFLPELQGGLIEGRLVNRENQQGLEGATVALNILNKNHFDAVVTGKSGYFHFSLPDLGNAADVILSPCFAIDSAYEIHKVPDFDEREIDFPSRPFYLTPEEYDFLKEVSTDHAIMAAYVNGEAIAETNMIQPLSPLPFFHPADAVTEIDHYIRLSNIREVVFEVVPDVYVASENRQQHLRVYRDFSFAKPYQTLVLVDGIPITDHQPLLDLTPDRIERLEIKDRLYVHGNAIFSGIINFVSVNRDFAGLKLPSQSLITRHLLPNDPQVKIELAPHADNKPDLTLHYPVQAIDQTRFNFSTNDKNGTFTARVFGFDAEGKWTSTVVSFKTGPGN